MAIISGTNGGDTLTGGAASDILRGLRGDDLLVGGGGNDQFEWTYGDGADTVDGGEGLDTQIVQSFSTAAESFVVEKSGDKISVHAGATLGLDNVETLAITPFLGADTVEVRDFIGSDLLSLNINLAGYSGMADGAADTVILTGTAANDRVYAQLGYTNDSVKITTYAQNGHQRTVDVTALDGSDTVKINLGAGADAFNGAGALAAMSVNGGAGADLLIAGAGGNTLRGGLDDDQIYGGDGKDTIIWANGPLLGDGADTIDGGAGLDTLIVIGAAPNITSSYRFEVEGDKLHALVGPQLVVENVETVRIEAVGSYDLVEIGDLSATDVRNVEVNLAGADGVHADGVADVIELSGADGRDAVVVTLGADNASLQMENTIGDVVQTVKLSALDSADQVSFKLGAGDDSFTINGPAGTAPITVEGGAGADTVALGAEATVTLVFTGWQESGGDVITGFQGHVDGGDDLIVLRGWVWFGDGSYEDMVANGHLIQAGSDVLITDGARTMLTLQDIKLTSLSGSDFLFG